MPILAHIVTSKSGHAFNHAFLKSFFKNKASWQTLTLNEPVDLTSRTAKSLAI
jgi:UDP-3-O-[3-hydroxymyristoyl] N-acetylglucosamine deacetylase